MSLRFRFTYFDRNDTGYIINEPIGWDRAQLNLDRDKDAHGLTFSYSTGEYEYQGLGGRLLQNEYEAYGAQGIGRLLIEETCEGEDFDTLFNGKFVFGQYQRVTGSDCNVKCPIEDLDDVMTFRNRIDQAVNLETTTSFDGVTSLAPYAGLPKEITLPPKAVFAEDRAINVNDVNNQIYDSYYNSGEEFHVGIFYPIYDTKVLTEIGGFEPDPGPSVFAYDFPVAVSGSSFSPPAGWVHLDGTPFGTSGAGGDFNYFPIDDLNPIINYSNDLGQTFGPFPQPNFTIRVKTFQTFARTVDSGSGNNVTTRSDGAAIFMCRRNSKNEIEWLSNPTDFPVSGAVNFAGSIHQQSVAADSTYTPFTLSPGDRIYLFGMILYNRDSRYITQAAFNMSATDQSDNNIFSLSGLTIFPETVCKTFLINEAVSRTVEAITDDKIRAYSEYFGRTDSEPYSVDVDGEGSLACITTGKFIRRLEETRPDQLPQINVSINDLIADGLKPVHNIGYAIEPDTNRPGFNRLRYEPWPYFYQDDVVLECIGVNNVTISAEVSDYYSTFKFGSAKWEAESFNGIDEFLTDRTYRTDLAEVNNILTVLTKFILSGYAWEVTRRIGNYTSEDWRYDDDVFMLSLKRGGPGLDPFLVERGGISSAANIIDPDTIYNFRWSPLRVAMKWLPEILRSYRVADISSKITFTKGTGNYYAEGEQTTTFFKIEDGVIVENQVLTPDDMDTPSNGLPWLRTERVTFQFPMTIKEYKQLRAAPNKRIYWETDTESGSGWIKNFSYNPWDGLANFTLIPKIEA